MYVVKIIEFKYFCINIIENIYNVLRFWMVNVWFVVDIYFIWNVIYVYM